jgi:hypothetical protein
MRNARKKRRAVQVISNPNVGAVEDIPNNKIGVNVNLPAEVTNSGRQRTSATVRTFEQKIGNPIPARCANLGRDEIVRVHRNPPHNLNVQNAGEKQVEKKHDHPS